MAKTEFSESYEDRSEKGKKVTTNSFGKQMRHSVEKPLVFL